MKIFKYKGIVDKYRSGSDDFVVFNEPVLEPYDINKHASCPSISMYPGDIFFVIGEKEINSRVWQKCYYPQYNITGWSFLENIEAERPYKEI